MGKVSYGLLLPHFGEHASASSLIEGAKRAEELEFDSVWVRDHFLRFHGHGLGTLVVVGKAGVYLLCP